MKVDRNHPLAVSIRKQITEGLAEYNMISDGDRVLVCASGGKDSSILAILMDEISKKSKRKFSVEAVILDQKQPGFEAQHFQGWMGEEGIKLHVVERDTYSIVKEKTQGKTYCALCSKLRRGILYDFAVEKGFTKVALGHHRNDVIETTLLNLFYVGQLSTMPAKLKSDDERNILIRPMVFVDEGDLIGLSQEWGFPIIPCNLCGSQEGMKRKKMKMLVKELEKEIPNLSSSFMKALRNTKPSHLLDRKLYDFDNL